MVESWRLGWARHVVGVGEKRNEHILPVENPEGQRPLGRLCCKERVWECVDSNLAQDIDQWRVVVHTIMRKIQGFYCPLE
jgi:hypothetical protein